MTLEPSMLAVEQRLQRLASEMPVPDVDAGWETLSAQLGPSLAPVIPLRRASLGRPIALAAAAALLVAGAALAAVTHGGSSSHHVAPVASVASPGHVSSGPHLHAPFAGPPAVRPAQAITTTPVQAPTQAPTQPATNPGDGSVSGTASGDPVTMGGSGDGTHQVNPKDDPNDLDQGVGNDGQHNDQGGGNNGTEGSQQPGQGGQGGGQGH